MRPTDLVDDREPKPVRFGGRRKRGAPVLRIRRTRVTGRAMLGALGGAGLGVLALRVTGEPMAAGAMMALGAAAGAVYGSRERDDVCATCEGSLKVEDTECLKCDAPIGGTIAHVRERAEGEERMRKERVAARKKAEAGGAEPAQGDE
jgi:outer membrane lipoprotein SlyB